MIPTKTIYYFAYGSNMSTARLQARVPSAKCLGVYSLPGYTLDFSMHGFDDSAKCNGRQTNNPNDQLYGVLFSMLDNERPILDFHEQLGEGYEIIDTIVFDENAQAHPCFVYTALRLQKHLQPFDWYRHHVLFGAKEAGLPQHVIEYINNTTAIVDQDHQRAEEQMSIYTQTSIHE